MPSPDPVLVGLAGLAARGTLSVTITLFVNGQIVEGKLTSIDNWIANLPAALQESGLSAGFKVAAKSTDSSSLHLLAPRIRLLEGDSHLEYATTPPTVIRISVEAVAGWHIGVSAPSLPAWGT